MGKPSPELLASTWPCLSVVTDIDTRICGAILIVKQLNTALDNQLDESVAMGCLPPSSAGRPERLLILVWLLPTGGLGRELPHFLDSVSRSQPVKHVTFLGEPRQLDYLHTTRDWDQRTGHLLSMFPAPLVVVREDDNIMAAEPSSVLVPPLPDSL